jgi:hypothetical protein
VANAAEGSSPYLLSALGSLEIQSVGKQNVYCYVGGTYGNHFNFKGSENTLFAFSFIHHKCTHLI